MYTKSKKILDILVIACIFCLSFIYFYKVIFAKDCILVHGDYRYGLTVQQHVQYHLNEIFIHAPKLILFIVLYLAKIIFGDILAEKLFTVFVLFLSAFFVYLSNIYFLERIFDREDWKISISAFVGTLLFLYNPWTINKIHHHYWEVLSLATSYLLLAEVDRIIHDKFSYFRILLISFLTIIIATQIQSIIIYAGFMIDLYFFCFIVFERLELLRKILNKKLLFSLLIFIFLNSFWILPQIMTVLSGISKPGSYGIVAENIDTLSRRCNVLNIIRGINGFLWGQPYTVVYSIHVLNFDIWKPASLIPFIIAISSLLFLKSFTYKKRKYILYFAILLIFSILFSTGSYYPVFGDLYRKIFLDTNFGWVIRDPYKNTGLVIISLSFFVSLVIQLILEKRDLKIKPLAIALIVLPILIWGWPALTGDLNGHLKPYLVKYPKDLEETISYLKTHLDYKYNILWYPPKIESIYFAYHDVPQISTSGLNVFTIENEELVKYIENLLEKKDINDINLLMKKLAIKYIILRHDLIKSNQKKRLLRDIQSFENLFKKYEKTQFGNFTIYQIKNPNQIIEANTLITYSTSASLNKDFIFDDTVEYIYFNNFYVIENNYLTSLFSHYLIKIRSKHYDPEKYWSFGTFTGGWLKRFIPYLKKFSIENWQSDYGYGLVFTWAKNTNLTIPFKVDKTDNYKLFVRYFENQKGGEIKVYLDGKPIVIKTKDQLNKFVWKDLGTFYLKAGEHKITLQNVYGFNAVNVFALIPVKDYIKAKKEVEKLLQNKTIIYLFEAESDLYRTDAKIVKGANFSDGEALALTGKAWQNLTIVKNGTYRIALRGVGSFTVRLGNHTFHLESDTLRFVYTPPFRLSEGRYTLTIEPESKATLDVVWLYSSNKTLQQLFEVKEKPAKVVSYQKINPTLWKVKVRAKKPFMLSFAEAYDPLWEARVYKDGKLVKKVRSIPLYSVINGFWINETGNLTIVIRYLPQDWFELGLKISALTFVGCIGYLFYDWRRERGDRWAKDIERRLNENLSKFIAKVKR